MDKKQCDRLARKSAKLVMEMFTEKRIAESFRRKLYELDFKFMAQDQLNLSYTIRVKFEQTPRGMKYLSTKAD